MRLRCRFILCDKNRSEKYGMLNEYYPSLGGRHTIPWGADTVLSIPEVVEKKIGFIVSTEHIHQRGHIHTNIAQKSLALYLVDVTDLERDLSLLDPSRILKEDGYLHPSDMSLEDMLCGKDDIITTKWFTKEDILYTPSSAAIAIVARSEL